jgi:hypothetical protein
VSQHFNHVPSFGVEFLGKCPLRMNLSPRVKLAVMLLLKYDAGPLPSLISTCLAG